MDRIICNGLVYECYIGFHDCEKGVKYPLTIDLAAEVSPIPSEFADQVDYIQFDYHIANQNLRDLITDKQFNLIETVAERVADFLLVHFPIHAITVRVTKSPIHMSNVKAVAYECRRTKKW